MGIRPVSLAVMIWLRTSNLATTLAGLRPADSRRRLSPHNHHSPHRQSDVASSVDLGFAQLLDCGFRTDRGIIHFLEGIGARLGSKDGQNFDVPVVVLINRLPVTEILRGMEAAGRS